MAEPGAQSGRFRLVPVMGTVFTVDVRDPHVPLPALERVIRWWRWVDITFSPFRGDSAVSRLNARSAELGDCPIEVAQVLSFCEQAKEATAGYFDAYATGQLDPCGLVKGWSIETASMMLSAAGSQRHCINGGGDIRCVGGPTTAWPWQIGIEDPFQPMNVAAILRVADGAIATSGMSQRGQHVVNPHSGRPADELASVTIVGADLTWADAYATAALAMGGQAHEWLSALHGYEGLVICANGALHPTPGLLAKAHGLKLQRPRKTHITSPC
jgi:thiamine biosynthesis lipoprotein